MENQFRTQAEDAKIQRYSESVLDHQVQQKQLFDSRGSSSNILIKQEQGKQNNEEETKMEIIYLEKSQNQMKDQDQNPNGLNQQIYSELIQESQNINSNFIAQVEEVKSQDQNGNLGILGNQMRDDESEESSLFVIDMETQNSFNEEMPININQLQRIPNFKQEQNSEQSQESNEQNHQIQEQIEILFIQDHIDVIKPDKK